MLFSCYKFHTAQTAAKSPRCGPLTKMLYVKPTAAR